MKTIKEHNDEVLRTYNTLFTGVECPNCQIELQYRDTMRMLSSPAQKMLSVLDVDTPIGFM